MKKGRILVNRHKNADLTTEEEFYRRKNNEMPNNDSRRKNPFITKTIMRESDCDNEKLDKNVENTPKVEDKPSKPSKLRAIINMLLRKS